MGQLKKDLKIVLLVWLLGGSLPAHAEPRQISGVYPDLTTYGIYSENGAHTKAGHNECGIGAVVPWAGKLWMINYAPHMPKGSEHKLYSVDAAKTLTIHPESVGGTPAGRLIHRESDQLLIGPYLIDRKGKVRVITPKAMPSRITAIVRHLKDPANMVYYYDMEGMLYEANVHTLAVRKLYHKPVPGWHGKGAYTGQGRLVISNNGEHPAGSLKAMVVKDLPKSPENAGVLAEWDGKDWRIIERRQYTDITGPGGIHGAASDDDPIWAIGWDRRSLRLKLLDGGEWSTYLLPKAAHNNDAKHGWYTEWPRIRAIGGGRWMMDMHGMFFDFPKTFSRANSAGIAPIGSHLRYVPDFCDWNGKLVLASDETSIQGNRLAGQPQSNLWIGDFADLKKWGPSSGYGGPWVGDKVEANVASDPFLINGFGRRVLHLAVGRRFQTSAGHTPPKRTGLLRATDQQAITSIPDALAVLPHVTLARGNWKQPAPGFSFKVDTPSTVYLAVDHRGDPNPGKGWAKTNMTIKWGQGHHDVVYKKDFAAGTITIPGNATEHTPGSFGMPHAAFILAKKQITIKPSAGATVTRPKTNQKSKTPERSTAGPSQASAASNAEPVRFTLEIDAKGDGRWSTYKTITIADGQYGYHVIPPDLSAQWMRLKVSRDCVATAFFHLTDSRLQDGAAGQTHFAGLADVSDGNAIGGWTYAAKRNRNLRLVNGDETFEFDKKSFTFRDDKPDPKLERLLQIEPEFTVDQASVILMHRGKRLRLPMGDEAFDKPFAGGWPRGSREVQSERHLANFHGTFYEVPLITNGAPPAFDLMRPVASHRKQIVDFCSWNGLLVLTGVRLNAKDEHTFINSTMTAGVWFGGVDDLWKLGKPQGRGGPWKNTKVKANVPSDPYLMKGYDRKTVTLSHDHVEAITMTLEVDIAHDGQWYKYDSFVVPAGEALKHQFPEAYAAHWVRVRTDRDATATAWFLYE